MSDFRTCANLRESQVILPQKWVKGTFKSPSSTASAPTSPRLLAFDEIDSGVNESKLLFRLIHSWEARNPNKGGLLIGLELLLIDEKYLANSGEDGVVRVWKVIEVKRSRLRRDYLNEVNPSCMYFQLNDLSHLKPVLLDEEKPNKTTESFKKTSDSSCVVFPPKVFRIMEKPLYEFKGHMGEVLDISWSKDNSLLSTSMDKTVRLRKVGGNACRGVFPHNSYVTSVQFNPVNENYFISGSIDGKVRIWNISGCNFVDWELSIREEICPPISLPLIKRILCNFTPDEFCPDHVPGVVLEELNSAESNGNEKLSEEDFPYAASSVSYMPPSTMDVAEKVAEAVGKLSRNVSMIQRKGYTSGEELEELDSLLTSKKFGCGCHLKRKKKLEGWP